MNLKLILIIFCLSFIGAINAQEEKSPYDLTREQRIARDRIFGVYIPKDLGECFTELDKKIDADSKSKMKFRSEDEVAEKLHYSFGRWMIVNWSFYEGSRITVFLNKMGVFHPDDMADFIIRMYHRHLNKKPLDAKDLVKSYQDKRKKERDERLKKGTIISTETRKITDTLELKRKD